LKNDNKNTIVKNHYTEQEIVAACLEDDRKMQKVLYDKYCDAMFTTSYRILSDFEIANDSLQEAFLKVFLNLKKFRGESTLGAWIKKIVVRTALKRLKKEKLFVPLDESHIELLVSIPNDYKSDYLEKAVFELPDGFRTIFVMIEIEGYSHKEVADFLSISESTSRSQLFHAKRRLREKILKMRNSV
jgi:RNA polymerase sigma-70 factor (ECF subfamily)